MAEKAIQMRDGGQTNEAETAFRQFAEAWQNVEKAELDNPRVFDKRLGIKAAECLLAFGQSSNALAIITSVIKKTGRSLPPEAPYIYIKSTFAIGNYKATIDRLEGMSSQLKGLPAEKAHELAIIGARAATKLGDTERAKKFLKEAVSIAPETKTGMDAQKGIDSLDHSAQPER